MKRLFNRHKIYQSTGGAVEQEQSNQSGFTLVEVVVAMVITLVALLGVFGTFTYAINYNAGNNSRSQALAVLQQEVELMRSLKFTPASTDPGLTGGVKAQRTVSSADNNSFLVDVTVDNDPFTAGVQSTDSPGVTIKEIKITVTLDSPSPGWQTSVPSTVVLRRVRAN